MHASKNKMIAATVPLFIFSFCVSVRAQWTVLNSGTTKNLRDVFFIDTNAGISVGDSGTIVRTADGGSNWSSVSSGTTKNLYCIIFTDAQTGYIAGASGTILKSTNAGAGWSPLSSGVPVNLNAMYFTDANTGFAVGDNGVILKTINAGANWALKPTGVIYILNTVRFTDDNTGYAAGANGTILKTTDGGENWNLLNSSTSELLSGIYFINDSTGYVVGNNGVVRKTKNSGANWDTINTGFNIWLKDIYCIANGFCYAAGNYGNILKSVSDAVWTSNTSVTGEHLQSLYFLNANRGYIAGSNGTILQYVFGNGIPANEFSSSENPLRVFPNPFYNQTTFAYELRSKAHVTLEVYNLLGQQLTTLINEEQTPGNYGIGFNPSADGRPNGLFIVRLIIDNRIYSAKIVSMMKN